MEALGALNPVDVVEGEIQSKVAEFLGLKSVLNGLRSHSLLNIRAEAEELYVTQNQLEADLAVNLERIKVMKSGAWDMSGIVQIGSFAMYMVKQIKNVRELDRKAKASGVEAANMAATGTGGMMELMLSPVGLGVMGVGLYLLFKR